MTTKDGIPVFLMDFLVKRILHRTIEHRKGSMVHEVAHLMYHWWVISHHQR